MAWVSGVFSRLHNWVNDRDANIKILATRHDAEDDNLSAGINNTLTKDGQNTATANLPMGNFRHTGVGNASARTDYSSAAQIQDSGVVYATDTGTVNTYAIALGPAITAYTLGNLFWFRALNSNTGASTLNVNGLGAKTILRQGGDNLIVDDILSFGIYGAFFDSTNFQLISPLSKAYWQTLNKQTVSAVATIDANLPSGFRAYRWTYTISVSNDDVSHSIRFQTSGGAFRTGATDYGWSHAGHISIATGKGVGQTNAAAIRLFDDAATATQSIGNAAGEGAAGTIHIHSARDSGRFTLIEANGIHTTAGGEIAAYSSGGLVRTAEDNDAVRMIVEFGTITGTLILEGLPI